MMMGVGFLGTLLFLGILLALFIGGATIVLRKATGNRPLGGQSGSEARQVLDERFARGEISAEEYETIRAQIER